MWEKIKQLLNKKKIVDPIQGDTIPKEKVKPKKKRKKKQEKVKTIKEIKVIEVPVEKENPKEYIKEIDGKPVQGRELLPENTLSSYTELINFIQHIPSSSVGDPISRYFYHDKIKDPRVESVLEGEEALWIMNKYKITIKDRKNLISAILNTKILNA